MQIVPSKPLFAGLLVLLVLAAYSSALRGGFVWDDDDHVAENIQLRSGKGLRRIWIEPTSIPQYYPLVHTTWWLEYRLWGTDPTGYHVVNALLHALAAFLAWRVLRRLRVPGAAVAAMIFALHPVHVESVAWITERKNVLSGLFFLAALAAYLRFEPPEEAGTRGRRRTWFLAFGLFLLALLSKTVTAGLPAAILLLLWWKRGRLRWRAVVPLLPFFVVGVAMGLHTSFLERTHVGAIGPEWDFSFVERVLIAGRASWFHLGKLLWPHPLVFTYPRWAIDAGAWWQYLFPLAALGLVAALWVERQRYGRGPLTAVLFFGGMLFPALGFFDVYPMLFSFVADHFQYLASLGPIALAAAAGTILLRERGSHVRVGVTAAVLVGLGGLTWWQGRAYASARTLWEHVLAANPDAWLAHDNLGGLLAEEGDLEAAESHCLRALELKPDNAGAVNNLGRIRLEQERYAEAKVFFERALAMTPDLPEAHANLGRVLMLENDDVQAERHLRLAIEYAWHPKMERVYLARLLLARNELAEAEAELRRVIRDHPDLAAAHLDLGRVFVFRDDLEEAARHFDRALALQPEWSLALYLRGRTHLDRGERTAAFTCFERAIRADPEILEDNPDLRALWEERGGD